jgi:hypothetical protein
MPEDVFDLGVFAVAGMYVFDLAVLEIKVT